MLSNTTLISLFSPITLIKSTVKLKDGNKPEDIIEGLAEEIASKNAFHVSKILDQSFSSKNRDN